MEMETASFWPSFFKMLIALSLVLGVLVGAMYLFGRLMRRTAAGTKDDEVINIVATRYLGPKNTIMLLEVLDNYVLIGLANNQISHLGAITPTPEARGKLDFRNKMENRFPSWADSFKGPPLMKEILIRWGKGGKVR